MISQSNHVPPWQPTYQEPISVLNQAGDVVIFLLAAGLTGLLGWQRTRRCRWLGLTALSQTMLASLSWILRSPRRHPPSGQGLVLAASDGTIESIQRHDQVPFLRTPAQRVVIALSLLRPQTQRAPLSGVIRQRRYELPGQSPSRERRHSQWLAIEQVEDRPAVASGAQLATGEVPPFHQVLMRLVASSLWQLSPFYYVRRIICWPELGDVVQAGQQIGHLPLGGMVEMYLPATSQILVRPGQRVRAGETILAALPS